MRRGRRRSLREVALERSLRRELARIRRLLQLERGVYDDLFVMKRAREELEELARDDRAEDLEEEELLYGDEYE